MLAIPAHLAHHFLSGRVRAIVRDLEWAGNEIMKYLLTDYRTRAMITRPLDLASRLSPEPRSFDFLFYVNVGLLALFFALFGSRFVLAPGLGVDFRLPQAAGARAGATGTTCYISVLRSGQILTDNGLLSIAELPDWLKARAQKDRQPRLAHPPERQRARGRHRADLQPGGDGGFCARPSRRRGGCSGPAGGAGVDMKSPEEGNKRLWILSSLAGAAILGLGVALFRPPRPPAALAPAHPKLTLGLGAATGASRRPPLPRRRGGARSDPPFPCRPGGTAPKKQPSAESAAAGFRELWAEAGVFGRPAGPRSSPDRGRCRPGRRTPWRRIRRGSHSWASGGRTGRPRSLAPRSAYVEVVAVGTGQRVFAQALADLPPAMADSPPRGRGLGVHGGGRRGRIGGHLGADSSVGHGCGRFFRQLSGRESPCRRPASAGLLPHLGGSLTRPERSDFQALGASLLLTGETRGVHFLTSFPFFDHSFSTCVPEPLDNQSGAFGKPATGLPR